MSEFYVGLAVGCIVSFWVGFWIARRTHKYNPQYNLSNPPRSDEYDDDN